MNKLPRTFYWIAVLHTMVAAVVFYLTVSGIPAGKQHDAAMLYLGASMLPVIVALQPSLQHKGPMREYILPLMVIMKPWLAWFIGNWWVENFQLIQEDTRKLIDFPLVLAPAAIATVLAAVPLLILRYLFFTLRLPHGNSR